MAYRMAEMWPERVEKVVIASSGVNMRRKENAELLKRAKVEKIEDLMLPTAAWQLRKLMGLSVFRRLYMPNFFLNDLIDVSRFFTLSKTDHKLLSKSRTRFSKLAYIKLFHQIIINIHSRHVILCMFGLILLQSNLKIRVVSLLIVLH